MKRFIQIEGPDGTGKSTTVERLAQALDYIPIKTPAEKFRRRREEYDAPGVDPLKRFMFYAEGVQASASEIQKILKQGGGVVADRYTLSLEHYHQLMDPNHDYRTIMSNLYFPQPDATIVLVAPMDVLKERIEKRNGKTDSHLERDYRFLEKVLNRFEKNGDGGLRLDTGKLTVDEVVQECLTYLQ